MAVIKRVVKPKTRRGKMALQEREPKAIENRKKTIVVRGPKCSQTVQVCKILLLEVLYNKGLK